MSAVTTKPKAPVERHITCDQGHRHWGQYGAAGLLLRYTDEMGVRFFYLQWRAPWLNEGNCFSIPGGAMARGETPERAARREAKEELGPFRSKYVATVEDAHGGWSYFTVIHRVRYMFEPWGDGGREHVGGFWADEEQIYSLPLHPDFEAMLSRLMEVD